MAVTRYFWVFTFKSINGIRILRSVYDVCNPLYLGIYRNNEIRFWQSINDY